MVHVTLQHSFVSGLAKSTTEFRSIELELTALLLYAIPTQIFDSLHNHELQYEIKQLRDITQLPTQLKHEINNLRTQLGILADYCNCTLTNQTNTNDTINQDIHSESHTHTHNNNNNKHKRVHRFISPTRMKQKHSNNTTHNVTM